MNSPATTSLSSFVRWLAGTAGFPAHRLPAHAERLLLVAVAAAAEEQVESARPDFQIKSQNPAQNASLRSHAMRRSQVHFKSDNSAKV